MIGNANSVSSISGPAADVVHDERPDAVRGSAIDHQPDVRQVAGQHPRHHVARRVVGRVRRARPRRAAAPEERLQVRHAAMIDVRIGPRQAPRARIRGERGAHVLVDPLLQVDADGAIGTDDDVGADADVGRHVAHRIRDAAVGAVVAHRVRGLRHRRGDEADDAVRRPRRRLSRAVWAGAVWAGAAGAAVRHGRRHDQRAQKGHVATMSGAIIIATSRPSGPLPPCTTC